MSAETTTKGWDHGLRIADTAPSNEELFESNDPGLFKAIAETSWLTPRAAALAYLQTEGHRIRTLVQQLAIVTPYGSTIDER